MLYTLKLTVKSIFSFHSTVTYGPYKARITIDLHVVTILIVKLTILALILYIERIIYRNTCLTQMYYITRDVLHNM